MEKENSHEHEMVEVEVISLPMDDGTTQDFAIMENFSFNGDGFIAIAEVIDDHVSSEFYIMRKNDSDGTYESIDDEAEYEKVAEFFNNNIAKN